MKIYIYDGSGIDKESKNHFIYTFETLYPNFSIIFLDACDIKHTNWHKNAALFILPGGADLFYLDALKHGGNDRILSYVHEGGNFLGICAGAYYASEYIEFAKCIPHLAVTGDRPLKFFPSKCIGPMDLNFKYGSYEGAQAISVKWMPNHQPPIKLPLYMNGGGYFKASAFVPQTKIIASYDEINQPAILKINIGKGLVILSGVHFEYDPELLDDLNNPGLKNIKESLREYNDNRLKMVKEIFSYFGIRSYFREHYKS